MVVAWGTNSFGQTNVPPGLTNAVAVAAGDAHSLALKSDGTVVAWGTNDFLQTNVPVNVTNAIAISAGGRQSLALKKDGTIVQWGQPFGAPPAITAVAIASGTNFHLALRTNGTVVAWGNNTSGQTNVPPNLSNVVAIAAGGAHGLALKVDGTVVAWGNNSRGQTSVPGNLTNAMAIAAGYAHSLALSNNGTVVAWGDNTYGQTNTPALVSVKLLAAGGYQSLVSVCSPLVQYPVDVTKDLLLIYNTNSVDSFNVWSYYMQHRPMVTGANVLPIGCTTNEAIRPEYYTNVIAAQVQSWLSANPTKRPSYIVLFPDIPSQVDTEDVSSICFLHDLKTQRPSVQYGLYAWSTPGCSPFVTSINMGDTNACKAYIDKLQYFGTNCFGTSCSPGSLFISALQRGYGNTNYYFELT